MKLIALALVVFLSACGGGGDAQTVQAAHACRVSVLLDGDSTMWGYAPGGGGVRASVYPELALQQEMNARFGVGVVTVTTGAVPGATSADVLTQPRNADIVVYSPGINDVAYGVPVETYKANLRQLALVPGAVFETPTPVWQQPGYDQAMREVAAETGVPVADARAYALSIDWWTYATDGVHPTSDGYGAIVRNALAPRIAELVGQRCR